MRTWNRLALLPLSSLVLAVPAYAQQAGCYLAYDGTDDRVEIASSAFPLFEYTLSAWVRTKTNNG